MPKEKYDYEILDEAMNNAYSIIMGLQTFDTIIEKEGECTLPFDIREEEPDMLGMIDYFIETEEYEKCEVLKKLMDNDNTHSRADIK
jgi:putative IMPACT (imprinted ancient) family translation regulator|tara:strand:+ start:509 stop:769 length:261 start_codon:yes stop_codon:yes gene_type:complete